MAQDEVTCCKLNKLFICGVTRSETNPERYELRIRKQRVLENIDGIIYEVAFLLEQLKEMRDENQIK